MPIVIDDFLPVTGENKPAFSSSKKGELWVAFLEKAWAKLHGSYARTEEGTPSFVATHIMGVPSESILHASISDEDIFYDQIKKAFAHNSTAIVSKESFESDFDSKGLIPG